MNHIVIFGYPGSGKGTLLKNLTSYGYLGVGIGDILRKNLQKSTSLGQILKQYIMIGRLIPDDIAFNITTRELKKILIQNKFFALEGFPNTINQFKLFQDFLHQHNLNNSINYIYLNISEALALDRIRHRLICLLCNSIYNQVYSIPKNKNICDHCGNQLFKRPEDNVVLAKQRILQFQKKTIPIIEQISNLKNFIKFDASNNHSDFLKKLEIFYDKYQDST